MSGILSAFIGRVAGVVTDAYFNLVTLLLPGNGTNGAQNNTFLDSSTNNFTITRNGGNPGMTQGTFSPFSQTGWSNSFDGTDDYLSVADNAVLRPGAGVFTLEAWIYRGASGAAHTIYAKGGASTGIVFQVASTNVLRFTHTTTNIDSTGTIASDSWVHVAVVREGTGTNQTKLYINGTQDGQGTVSTDFTQTEEVRIGTDRSAAADFNGYISNLRFTKGAALYTGNFTPATSPLTTTSQGASSADVELLTCQSNRFIDNSSNAFAITVVGTPSVQAFSPFAPTAAYDAATVGGSGYFDGTGDYLSVASNAAFALGTGDFTLEFWLYPTSATQRNITFPTVGSPIFFMNASSQLQFENYGSTPSITTTSTLQRNAWNHCVASRVSGTTRIFLNGVEGVSSAAFSATNFVQSLVNIGTDAGTTFCNGYMSDVRIVKGSGVTSVTVPTAPLTNITNTSLLLNFTNAGITDATAKNDLETVGNAQISTTQSKFGGSSMYFDGSGDYLSIRRTNLLLPVANQDFTFECWVYPTATPGAQGATIMGCGEYGTDDNWNVNINSSLQVSLYIYSINTGYANTTQALTTNAWHHIAVSRSGTGSNNLKIFVNGIGQSFTTNATLVGANRNFSIGADENGDESVYTGYIDDLRFTLGYARYTANFTPPTAAFPTQ